MNLTGIASLLLAGWVFSAGAHAAERVPGDRLSAKNFTKVKALIKPQADESLWRHIPWETSLNAARRKAAAAGKPLLIWAGGGSAPLGGC